jgi:hypothetical protein
LPPRFRSTSERVFNSQESVTFLRSEAFFEPKVNDLTGDADGADNHKRAGYAHFGEFADLGDGDDAVRCHKEPE